MQPPKLTEEQRQAIRSQPGGFIQVEDEQTHRIYVLIEESRANELCQQWLREQLQQGFDASDRGDVAEWDLRTFLAKMHDGHQRTAQAD